MIFKSLLVANRGEIALRIIKTASEMGIKCIAVYVDEDADSPHVKAADESFRVEFPDDPYPLWANKGKILHLPYKHIDRLP